MIVQLLNSKFEQVHFYEEDPQNLSTNHMLDILCWKGNYYTYHDCTENDAWGEYDQYVETNIRAVPTVYEVK